MALAHRKDELISGMQRHSDNLNEVLRGERNHNDAVLRYQFENRNTHPDIPDGPTGNSVEEDEALEELEYNKQHDIV